MAVNPMELMKLKERFGLFTRQHPKFIAFFQNIGWNAAREGTIVEIHITEPGGRERVTNMKLTADDAETIGMLRGLNH